ncbi:MAG: glycosyltransferase family 4 protein [Anaerolineales bacterium]
MQKSIDLTLFFTQGVSLGTWEEAGMFAREIALYKALRQREVEVTFVTYGGKEEMLRAKEIPGINLITNHWGLPEGWYQRQLKWLPPRGHIFKSNQVSGADVALTAARRRGAKFIARCGYLLSDFEARRHGEGSPAAETARRLERKVFTNADCVVVTTAAMSESVTGHYAVSRERLRVIPNYVETDRFRPIVRTTSKKFRIGYVGRLEPQKNLSALLEAITGMDVELSLVGQGSQLDMLSTQAKQSKANARFAGKIPNRELPQFLNSCDLFVLPSLYEGHPKSLLEAMACGLPVIGTRVPGIQELITDGENGLLCDTDAGSLRSAIQRAIDGSDLRDAVGKKARRHVEDNFSLSGVVDLEMTLLHDLDC